jgi:hypothetical protein
VNRYKPHCNIKIYLLCKMTYRLLENLSPYLSENMRRGVSCKEAVSGIDLMVKLEHGLSAHMTSVLYYRVHEGKVQVLEMWLLQLDLHDSDVGSEQLLEAT